MQISSYNYKLTNSDIFLNGIGHDSTVHFGEIKSSIDVQSILRRDLPVRDVVFVSKDLVTWVGHFTWWSRSWEKRGKRILMISLLNWND